MICNFTIICHFYNIRLSHEIIKSTINSVVRAELQTTPTMSFKANYVLSEQVIQYACSSGYPYAITIALCTFLESTPSSHAIEPAVGSVAERRRPCAAHHCVGHWIYVPCWLVEPSGRRTRSASHAYCAPVSLQIWFNLGP